MTALSPEAGQILHSSADRPLSQPFASQSVDRRPAPRPWLSVLVPVYNVEAYLQDCVESVMQQLPAPSEAGVELLLLNDASSDDSLRIASQLQQRWPQAVRLLEHPHNQGLSAARNSLLNHASGQYVWFLDSDDCLMPGAIAQLKQVVEAQAPDVVLCDFRLWREPEKFKHRLRGERHRASFERSVLPVAGTAGLVQDQAALLTGLFLSGQMHAWSKISKRHLWLASAAQPALQFPVGMAFEDMATMPRLLLRARSFVYVPEVWLAYRQRAGSILASMNAQKALDLGRALDGFAGDYPAQVLAEPALATPAVRFAIAHLAARNYLGALRALQHSAAAVTPEQRQTLAQSFFNCSPLTAAQLQQQYLRRGWWARYWRARAGMQYLQRGEKHA